jgi:hypothetical protein
MGKKWLFPLACVGLVIVSMLPAYTRLPYDSRNTQDVVFSVLSVSLEPYQNWGWVFHVATLLLILAILWKPEKMGRFLAGYIGLNYLVIAATQSHATTGKYGFALLTGALLGTAVLGIAWLVVAIRNDLKLSLHNIPRWYYLLLPWILLVFWSPLKTNAGSVRPNFDPALLLTSLDYGLAYCFATPVLLFLLILFSTDPTSILFRITAFNALLYGLFNQVHWLNPDTVWMGFMHLPLLILSLVALLVPYLERLRREKPSLQPS